MFLSPDSTDMQTDASPAGQRFPPCRHELSPLMPVFHRGACMAPLLRPGDCLRIRPYGGRKVARGDVVLIRPDNSNRYFAHRVVSTGSEGIKTRGDQALQNDPWTLSHWDIRGRVVSVIGKGDSRTIYGGWRGVLQKISIRWSCAVKTGLREFLRAAYHRKGFQSLLRRVFPLNAKVRVIHLKREGTAQWALLLGRRVIGRRFSEKGAWLIIPPFLLFLDVEKLPRV